jgi:tetratricopeptide (TPR) repeat protein
MKKPNIPIWIFGLSFVVLLSLLTGCANKTNETIPPQPTRDMALEKSFEKQLNAMNPTAVKVYQDATAALDAGNYIKSKLLYEQVSALAPNFSTAYRRLSYIELSINHNRDQALVLLRKAVSLEPDAFNLAALSMALMSNGTPSDNQEAYNLATLAVKLLPDDDQANLALLVSAASLNNLSLEF